ncbi:MAG: FHA domain-containing protein [Coriobacteriales bacterium]|jgi:hypothetical protein|nr:FHA domain-containing protein [Coriobacteriales bacterium]
MKIKTVKHRLDKTVTLDVALDDKQPLDYAAAMRLAQNAIDFFLPFTFFEDGKKSLLHYKVAEVVPLKTFLSTKLSLVQYQSLLRQIVELLDFCKENGLFERNVSFEPEHIFIQTQSNRLQFVYFPVTGMDVKNRAVLDLLAFVGAKAHFVCDEDRASATTLQDFIKRQEVFSVIDFKAFLGYQAPVVPVAQPQAASPAKVSSSGTLLRSKGRDFITENSGVVTAEEHLAAKSTAEQMLHAISEDMSHRPQDGATGAPVAADKTAGTSVLGSGSLAHNEAPVAVTVPSLVLTRLNDNTVWPIKQAQTIIGRSKTCTICVSDSTMVSRQHAVIHLDGNRAFISDNGSSNGTFINGLRLAPQQRTPLSPGDHVTLGDQLFLVGSGL